MASKLPAIETPADVTKVCPKRSHPVTERVVPSGHLPRLARRIAHALAVTGLTLAAVPAQALGHAVTLSAVTLSAVTLNEGEGPEHPQSTGASRLNGTQESAEKPRLKPFLQAASVLREWAATERGAEAFAAGEPDTALRPLIARCLGCLQALARETTVAEWGEADLTHTLFEVTIDAKHEARVALARGAASLASLAPSLELEKSLLCAAVIIAEPALGADSPAAEAGGHEATDLFGEVTHWIDRIETVVAAQAIAESEAIQTANTASSNGSPSFAVRARRRLQQLSLGQLAPRFVARDTVGNEVRSTDFIGKVTLYRFWSDQSPASIAAHQRDTTLMRHYWDLPFELVGISHDLDREGHIDRLEEHEFAGIQVFDGPISNELVDALAKSGQGSLASVTSTGAAHQAWLQPVAGSLFIVDSRGVVRGRDLAGGELKTLIDDLIAEHRSRLREQRLTGGSQ